VEWNRSCGDAQASFRAGVVKFPRQIKFCRLVLMDCGAIYGTRTSSTSGAMDDIVTVTEDEIGGSAGACGES
jgi:hypothetical protein